MPNDVPLSPCAQTFARELSRRIDAYPTICGGEAYFYAGREVSLGPAHGFVGAISELDSQTGLSTGALFEAGTGEGIVGGGGYVGTTNRSGQPAGAVLAYGGYGVSTPVASASAGVVGFGSGGNISGASLYGEGFLFGRGGGGGAYLNITNVGSCHQ